MSRLITDIIIRENKAFYTSLSTNILQVILCKGKKGRHTRIFRAEFKTNKNRVLAGGNYTNDNVTYKAPTGWQIVGFHGRSGNEVDRLGVIYAPILR